MNCKHKKDGNTTEIICDLTGFSCIFTQGATEWFCSSYEEKDEE